MSDGPLGDGRQMRTDFTRGGRGRARTSRVAVASAVAALLVVAGTQTAAHATSSCPNGNQNWYARATAPTNAGTSDGSNIIESMPDAGTYNVGAQGGTDEAAWVVNYTWLAENAAGDDASNGGFEIGWFMGIWPYATSYTYYYNPHPYYTTFNGTNGTLMSSNDLPENGDSVRYLSGYDDTTCPNLDVFNVTTGDDIVNSGFCTDNNGIIVPTPRDNLSQGEVASNDPGNQESAWMGGNDGNGLDSTGHYQDDSNHNYYNWGSFATCSNTPFWINTVSSNEWENGGVGN